MIAVSVAGLLLLAVDEIASQMEEPFGLIPLDDIMVTYERDINR